MCKRESSRKPRSKMGRNKGKEGEAMELKKVVYIRLYKHSSVLFWGYCIASKMRSNIPRSSAFVTLSHIGLKILKADALTFGWVSKTHSRSGPKISGIDLLKKPGARVDKSPMNTKERTLFCQLLWVRPWTRAGVMNVIVLLCNEDAIDAWAIRAESLTSALAFENAQNINKMRPIQQRTAERTPRRATTAQFYRENHSEQNVAVLFAQTWFL